MEGIKEVHQLDDRRLHWKAEIGGREKEWDAEITEQVPDQRIAGKSFGGATTGTVKSIKTGVSEATDQIRDETEQGLMRIPADWLPKSLTCVVRDPEARLRD